MECIQMSSKKLKFNMLQIVPKLTHQTCDSITLKFKSNWEGQCQYQVKLFKSRLRLCQTFMITLLMNNRKRKIFRLSIVKRIQQFLLKEHFSSISKLFQKNLCIQILISLKTPKKERILNETSTNNTYTISNSTQLTKLKKKSNFPK